MGDPEYKLDAWHLQLMGVASKYKHRGIGTELMKVVIDEVIFSLYVMARRPHHGCAHYKGFSSTNL